MKIHLYDKDSRKNDPNYEFTAGSFGTLILNTNKELKKLGYYAEPDEADWVGTADGLDLSFKYKNKKSFVWTVWDANFLTNHHIYFAQSQKMLGLSTQITNLYKRHDINCDTLHPGCDAEFWHPTELKAKSFCILFNSFSNVRSGLDLALEAYYKAFQNCNHICLIVKNTTDNPRVAEKINEFKSKGSNIVYINYRMNNHELRDLYSKCCISLNVMRMSSWGLGVHEAAACGCLPVLGDFCPSNEILPQTLVPFLKPSKEISIRKAIPELVNNYGLTNCYPLDWQWTGEPMFYDYNTDEYAELLKKIYNNWSDYSKLDIRNEVVKNWGWDKTAKKLVEYLYVS